MRSQISIGRSNRFSGRFFVFLALFCVILSCVSLYARNFPVAITGLFPIAVFGAIAWLILKSTERIFPSAGDSGLQGTGNLVPLRPAPTHHLAAAKEFPPSDTTHSVAFD
jgi:hypothetical protein